MVAAHTVRRSTVVFLSEGTEATDQGQVLTV
jgi:hypothetical protein